MAAAEPSLPDLLATVRDRLASPVAIVLGSPQQAAGLAATIGGAETTCYQMDLHPARRLEEELAQQKIATRVVPAPDLWDLPGDFQTVLYPAADGGERILKIDMVEQAFHILRPGGTLIVLSPYRQDPFFPDLLKKIFGKFHAPLAGAGRVIWAQRRGDRQRRRHEVTFHATVQGDGPLAFLSRPGIFSYGKLDTGARALLETAVIWTGDRVVDFGCGCGANGVFAGRRSKTGKVTFIDGNLRAIAVTEHNARAHGLADFRTVASCTCEDIAPGSCDVVLANPPYYAQHTIARLFCERSVKMLRPRGRFYLVTKQWEEVGPIVADVFGTAEVQHVRDYAVLTADAPGPGANEE